MSAAIRHLRSLAKEHGQARPRLHSPSIVADRLSEMTPGSQEDWEERAAILEYDAGLSREHAEQQALRLILNQSEAMTVPITRIREVRSQTPRPYGIERVINGCRTWTAPGYESIAF